MKMCNVSQPPCPDASACRPELCRDVSPKGTSATFANTLNSRQDLVSFLLPLLCRSQLRIGALRGDKMLKSG